jgi:carbon monoxide dehydrogenase subunit G
VIGARALAVAMAALLPGTLLAAGDADPCRTALEVHSVRQGERVRVDVRLELPVPAPVVWEVMTDYGQAARFIRNLRSSEVQALAPQRQRVRQLGWLGWGGVGVEIRTDYEVRLEPERWRVSGQLVAGDVKSMEMSARLNPVGTARTVLDYAVTTDPGAWVPALLVEGVLRGHARASFEDLAAEMRRRVPACSVTHAPPEAKS